MLAIAMHRSFTSFLRSLEQSGELLRISAPVSPLLIPAAVADAHARLPAPGRSPAASIFDPGHAALGGRALLFEHVEGCDFPLAINLFGSYRRMEMALGCDDDRGFEGIADRIASLVKPVPPRTMREAFGRAREFLPLLRIGPRLVRCGACQEVVRRTDRGEVDLRRLPIIKCWPLDGDPAAVGYPMTAEAAGTAGGNGRYITLAGMHTIHADDANDPRPASHNIGMYRAQLLGPTRLAMHWHMHHDGAAHWRSWKRAGKPMPIAICLGGESVLPYAATAPLPPGISELLMAGFLNGRGIPMVRGATVPIRVPANSEIVIEGYVSTEAGLIGWDPRDGEPLGPGAVFEGPFGDHTGFYSMPDRYPIVEVTAVTHRQNAVYPATVVGLPPQEDYYLGKATERIFLPLLKTIVPDIRDYHLPMFGAFHNCAFVQIDKAYPMHARRVMHAIWGAGQMSWTKILVIVDAAVDVHDERAVLRAVAQRVRFDRDMERVRGPLDILDHAAPRLGAGTKIGLDATLRWRDEDAGDVPFDLAPVMRSAGEARAAVEGVAAAAGLGRFDVPPFGDGRLICAAIDSAGADGEHGEHPVDRAAAELFAAVPGAFIILVNREVDPADWEAVFFRWCAHCDGRRDLLPDGSGGALFDATSKQAGRGRHGEPVRPWPPVLAFDRETEAALSDRAGAFGLSGGAGA